MPEHTIPQRLLAGQTEQAYQRWAYALGLAEALQCTGWCFVTVAHVP